MEAGENKIMLSAEQRDDGSRGYEYVALLQRSHIQFSAPIFREPTDTCTPVLGVSMGTNRYRHIIKNKTHLSKKNMEKQSHAK